MDAGSSSLLELPQQFRQFTISEIHLATQNFDESLIIGRGGFGMVYKGTISSSVVAVKSLDSSSNQGAEEFWNEVQMLSQLRHCHLVSLIGYCNDGQEMILLYEYMSRGTLEDHLYKFQCFFLPWVRRLKICIGAALGLNYLHTGTDESWDAKISDFGLSKLGPLNELSSYVNTLVKGTLGYLDPDYYATGRLTRKSDVYAIGVVLFEVLSGKQAVDRSRVEEHWGLVNWAQEHIKEGRLKQIVDCDIRETISPKCLKEFGRLAVRCVDSNPKKRPTMAEVVGCLESVLVLQEKANHTSHPSAGMKIFGNKVTMFLSSFAGDKSVGSKSSMELFFDTIGGENRILRRFEYGTITAATEDFSDNNLITTYFCGSMYKGRLQNGQRVSISWFNVIYPGRAYEDEVSLLVKLEHENLLKLLGYSIHGEDVTLVYDFAVSTSLGRLIDDRECTLLDWTKCNKIILGVARALLYFHRHDIIHGNVGPGNILLDESLDPTLSDFRVATSLPIDEAYRIQLEDRAFLLGHRPSEYMAKCPSTKRDVSRFGVLILETITGCTKQNYYKNNPSHCMRFKQYVWGNWVDGTSLDIVDPRICDAHLSSVTKVIHIGLLCVQEDPADRPTMEEVVGMLTNSSPLTLPTPKRPFSRRL